MTQSRREKGVSQITKAQFVDRLHGKDVIQDACIERYLCARCFAEEELTIVGIARDVPHKGKFWCWKGHGELDPQSVRARIRRS